MSKFVIQGPTILDGTIEVRGSKNAVLPILAASLLTKEPCVIDNVPRIEDVYRMIEMIESTGAKVSWDGEKRLQIDAKVVSLDHFKRDNASKLRASVLFLGPLLARLGSISMPYPGGDHIGRRPLDVHLNAFEALGAKVRVREDRVTIEAQNGLHGEEVVLDEISVTATENILMALALGRGHTRIKMAAHEPHVRDLARFLIKLGARIKEVGPHSLEIKGAGRLRGARHSVIYDPIEAGTFLILGALAKGSIYIKNIDPTHLEFFLKKLKDAGVRFEILHRDRSHLCDIKVIHSPRLKSIKVQTLPFPGIPTDLQALLGLFATQARGTSLIHDPLYENRFNYAKELCKMGAHVTFLDPHRAKFTGPTSLHGVRINSFDLRAGATLIIAGLIANGETVIQDAYQVDRGYEAIEERLSALGANIQRV